MFRRLAALGRIVTAFGLGTALSLPAAAQPLGPPTPGDATFNIFFRSAHVGFERAALARTEDGWIVRANGQVRGPYSLDIRLFEMTYDADWHPERLSIAGIRDQTLFSLESTFGLDVVTNELREDTNVGTIEHPVEPRSVVLPNFFFSAYEALAVRLGDAEVGTAIPIYVAPRGQIMARVTDVATQSLRNAAGAAEARIYHVQFDNPQAPLEAEIWVDQSRRLLRVSLPSASIDVARQDLTSVSTRLTSEPHPGDEDVQVRAAGFSLSATLTTPVDHPPPADGRWPVVLLVSGPSAGDRDATMSGVPVFRHLAHALADRGLMVMRYDSRGVGQSGGRIESATLGDYATDVRQLVRYLDRRDDVDQDRIVVAGHGDGGWIGLVSARRDDTIKALALMATAGLTGDELILERQRTTLEALDESFAARREQINLQRRIHRAVLGDGDWDDIPEGLRDQADTPWFRSLLEFEPGAVIQRVRQPLLVLQGTADEQVLADHAERLATMARARDEAEATVEVTMLDGINHQFVPAATGGSGPDPAEPGPVTTPLVADAIAGWIARTLR